jgi:outer membrane protein assembly factor BamB
LYGEYVFFGCDDGRLYAVNISTGESAWYFSPEHTIDDDVYNFVTTPFVSNFVIDNGILYVGLNGTIYALDAQTVETQENDEEDPDDGSDDQDDDQEDDETDEDETDGSEEDSASDEYPVILILFILIVVVLAIVLFSLFWTKKQNH